MNYKLISRLLGFIIAAVGFAFLVCLGVAWIYRENPGDREAMVAFSISAGIAGLLATTFWLASRGSGTQFFRKEALCSIGVGWLLASLLGALPFVLLLPERTVADAIFESASGFTTTGASILTNLEELPRSLLFWRSLTQWIGGLGVVVFFVAILSFLGAGGKILFSNESSGRSADIEQGRVRKGVLQLFYLYAALSVLCVVTLFFCGMSWYDAICHMFATVSTGGYSTRTASIAAYESPLIEWVLVPFMFLGGANFFFLILLVRKQWQQAKRITEVFGYTGIVLGTTLAFTAFLEVTGAASGFHEAIRASAFQVVSIMTTTGFVTGDFNQWPLFTKMGILCLMAIGGCSASTAGGIKVARIIVAFRVAIQSVERSFRTHVVRPVIMNGKPIDGQAQDSIVAYFMLIGLLFLISFPVIGLFETGLSLEAAGSAVFTTFFNVGPGFAELGPMENFTILSSPSKLYLSLLMIMGRLELFAILVLFAPSLWRKFS